MSGWVQDEVSRTWDIVEQYASFEDIIDDFGEDTGRDRSKFTSSYRGVSREEFATFGKDAMGLGGTLECEPFDEEFVIPGERPYVEDCYLERYQGESPLPDEFDVFAVWTLYPGGATRTTLYLTNDPV